MGEISSPAVLSEDHIINAFNSGETELDDWLKQRALKNQTNNASRTFVVHVEKKVVGYYSLATGSATCNEAPGKVRRNMPNPIPVMVLGRLAVDKAWQQHGVGRGLLKDALLRTIQVSQNVAVKALLLHTISDTAKYFYKRFGFIESPVSPSTLMLPLKDFEKYFE